MVKTTTLSKSFILSDKAKQVMRVNNVPEHLHRLTTALVICIFTDIGGYLFGKIFKGPRLSKISPNKTYSGVFGSFFISLMSGIIYIKYLGKKSKILLDTDPIFVILLILFISTISQIGDLIISYFKRKAKLKDTGRILPGHGGFLDRIDGIIFVMPITYLFVLKILISQLDLIK